MTCPSCHGLEEIAITVPCRPTEYTGGLSEMTTWITCPTCQPAQLPTALRSTTPDVPAEEMF
jgi:hypothetical protein